MMFSCLGRNHSVSFTISRHLWPMCSMKLSGRAPVILIWLEGRRSEFLVRLYLIGNY